MSLDWCKKSDVGLPKPDSVIYLTVNKENVSKRNDFGNERYEKDEMQAKVKENYELLKTEDWEVKYHKEWWSMGLYRLFPSNILL